MECIIIEDQLPAQRILKKFISDVPFLNLKEVFTDGLKASKYLSTNSIDLIFLDIHLPKISGIEFLKMLDHPPKVILTTAFSDYAIESYEHNVIDYLLKPFSFERFLKAVNRANKSNTESLANETNEESREVEKEIFIKSGYEHIRVRIEDIVYIKSDTDYTELKTKDRRHLSSESLKYWKNRFEKNQFIQTHKSFVINTAKIIKVVGNQIEMENGEKLPIGRYFKEDFVQKVLK